MHKNHPKSGGIIFFIAVLLISLTACQKEDYQSPGLQLIDANQLNDSILTSDTLMLRPYVNTYNSTVYEWKVNGELVSNDTAYKFAAEEPGDYVVDFRAYNERDAEVTHQYTIHVSGKFEHGIFIVNEGWFGHDKVSVNFYRYGADSIEQNVFRQVNPDKELGESGVYGALAYNRLYIISRTGPFVVADARTLKELGRIESLPAEGHAFLALDEQKALISTQDGIYPLDLASFSLGAKISGVEGQVGALEKSGDKVFALTETDGLVILNQSDLSVAQSYGGVYEGFAKTSDGKLWAGRDSLLVSVDPVSLDTTQIPLPFKAANPYSLWTAGSLSASTTENSVFISEGMPWGGGGTTVSKYEVGDSTSLQSPFISLPAGEEFYGSTPRYDASTNELVATGVQSGFGDNFSFNSLYFFDAGTGDLKKTIKYQNFYFPAIVVFNP